MEKAEEVLEKDLDKTMNFFNYMTTYDDESKANMLNMTQYFTLALVPIVIILKVIKEYVPEDDDQKGSIEIALEIMIQLLLIFFGIFFVDRIIRFIPTYSGVNYHKFNEINFIIPILLILVTMQTKLGAKVNILVERGVQFYEGQVGESNSSTNKIKSKQGQVHQASRGDTLDNVLIPPAAQSTNLGVDKSTTLINNLPNLNGMGESSNASYGADPMSLALMDSGGEPMAANGLLGSTFGGSW